MSERDAALQSLKARFERDAIEDAQRGHQRRQRFHFEGRVMAWLIVLVVFAAFGLLAVLVGAQAMTRLGVSDAIKQFCQAEQDGNFTAAHGFLSQRAAAAVATSDLADATRTANLLTCYSAESAWRIQVNDDRATVNVWFVPVGNSSQRDLGMMTLVRESGAWHIDTVTSDLLSLS